jgi:hypothetical protein
VCELIFGRCSPQLATVSGREMEGTWRKEEDKKECRKKLKLMREKAL